MVTMNAAGLATRTRNQDGRFRQKRADTHLGTLEARYGEISDRRSDTHLGTLREARGMSLSRMLRAEPEVTHPRRLHGRRRNQDGRIRRKHGSTLVRTLRETYGPDFLAGLPGNLPLSVVREATGMSLSQLVAEHLPVVARVGEGLQAARLVQDASVENLRQVLSGLTAGEADLLRDAFRSVPEDFSFQADDFEAREPVRPLVL